MSLLECTEHEDVLWGAKAAWILLLCECRRNPGSPKCSSERVICAPDGHGFSMPVVAGGMAVVVFLSRFLFQMMLRAAGGGGIREASVQTAAKQMNFAALLFPSLPVSRGGLSPECCLWTAAASWNFYQAFGTLNSRIFSYLRSVYKEKNPTKTTNQRNHKKPNPNTPKPRNTRCLMQDGMWSKERRNFE